MTQMSLRLGLDTIRSYKRLSYTIWYALAEFVDNSTQSYLNNKTALDKALQAEGEELRVDITYGRQGADYVLRVVDNAMGMSLAELDHALEVGARPANADWRCKFGMGLKTAACWIGDEWTVRTKKLGETTEYEVTIDVERVADGDNNLPFTERPDRPVGDHYTILEIRKLHREVRGQAVRRVKDYLRSMYRQDLRDGQLVLTWQGDPLKWEFADDQFQRDRAGKLYKQDFDFALENGKRAHGWFGVLATGGPSGRAKAGFSILHAGRVVKGWPDSWRPPAIFGEGGRNDLINQRIVGEIHLDAFEVTQAKDDILWFGDEEDQVEKKLKEEAAGYIAYARKPHKASEAEAGPSDLEVRTAVEELEAELTSDELVDLLNVQTVPPPEVIVASTSALLEAVVTVSPDFSAQVGHVFIKGYTSTDLSINDPYVIVDTAGRDEIVIIVNMKHPHVRQLSGSAGVLNYLRHCVYDAIAEWQARQMLARLDPDTIKVLKDSLLRLTMQLEMHAPESEEEGDAEAG